jgi:general secretion pathway protein G
MMHQVLKLALVSFFIMLVACADPVESGKQALEKSLGPGGHLKFRDVVTFPGDVVCGEYSLLDSWGEGAGFQRFVVKGGKPNQRPSDDDWYIHCDTDPAGVLWTRLGIGPVTADNKALQKIRRDMGELEKALLAYRSDFGVLPTTKQGLQALVTPPKARSDAKPRDTGYIDEVILDPWGHPYRYWRSRIPSDERAKYDLRTLGADGLEGGTGEDADIGLKELVYIDHVAGL